MKKRIEQGNNKRDLLEDEIATENDKRRDAERTVKMVHQICVRLNAMFKTLNATI